LLMCCRILDTLGVSQARRFLFLRKGRVKTIGLARWSIVKNDFKDLSAVEFRL
jgi:hypothetical protein